VADEGDAISAERKLRKRLCDKKRQPCGRYHAEWGDRIRRKAEAQARFPTKMEL
jgi:hypothetical protein